MLPILIRIGGRAPKLFELPASAMLEGPLSHPRSKAFAELGLRWFAVSAVSGMALDLDGVRIQPVEATEL